MHGKIPYVKQQSGIITDLFHLSRDYQFETVTLPYACQTILMPLSPPTFHRLLSHHSAVPSLASPAKPNSSSLLSRSETPRFGTQPRKSQPPRDSAPRCPSDYTDSARPSHLLSDTAHWAIAGLPCTRSVHLQECKAPGSLLPIL